MFDWIKKIKKRKEEDGIFVMSPEDEIPVEDLELEIPEEVVEKVTPEVVEKVTPEVFEEESKENVIKVKKVIEENDKPKKKATEPQPDADLGRLNLRKHVITKRRKYLAERKKYEKEYIDRLKKQQKAKPKKKKASSKKNKASGKKTSMLN